MMHYKGYRAVVAFDDQHDLFHGEVAGIRDVVTFQGRSVDELRRAFRDSVDDYLEFCRGRNEPPEKPHSGRFVLRIPPQLHRGIAALAARSGQSLNAWLKTCLENEIRRRPAAKVAPRTRRRKAAKT